MTNEALLKLAYIDEFTGLPNLHGLYKDYGKKSLDNVHFIHVDIDRLSRMNSIFGIEAVDQILLEVVNSLQEYCGRSNVYRIGAGQFLLVTESHIICEPEELKRILNQPIKVGGSAYNVRSNICVLDHDDFKGDDLSTVLKFLRFTINHEKRTNRNRLLFANQSMKNLYLEKTQIEKNIFNAVRNKDFVPKFAPFVDTFTNKIIGFETVSRWELEGMELKPDRFLEIAEWTGLIYAIEMNMFRETISFINELRQNKKIKLSSRFKASVNFSAYTLKHVKVNKLKEIIYSNNCVPSDFIIEIHEHFITDPEAYEKVQELHDTGFLIALDEYTNVSSSLTYLADLKVDILKLSECLLNKVSSTQEYTKMFSVYKFMSEIGKKFNLTIVSTGIEKIEDIKLVKSLDINIGAGKFYSKAVSKEEFLDLFKTLKVKRG